MLLDNFFTKSGHFYKGERIVLTDLKLSDYAKIKEITYYDGRVAQSAEDAVEIAKKIEQDYKEKRGVHFAVRNKSNMTILGTCGFYRGFNLDELSDEIGYIIKEEFRRKGYMIEALNLLIKIAKNEIGLKQILAYVKEDNVASQNLFLRCNFRELSFKPPYRFFVLQMTAD